MLNRLTYISLLLLIISTNSFAESKHELCVYKTEKGKIVQVNSRKDVPSKYRKYSQCYETNVNTYLAPPDEMKLKGTTRKESMASSVGRIQLRWPRSVEKLFGRTPQRAMAEAARAVSRALKRSGFPTKLQTLDMDWNVVFLDSNLPEKQIPYYLVSNCHPGWMTPPANIYIVGQRIAGNCGGGSAGNYKTSVADSELAQTLVHEMGHVIEYQLLELSGKRNRMRSEGFANWFEQYASDFVPLIKKGQVKKYYMGLAKASISQSPDSFSFRGTGHDYARASLYFHAIVKRKGIRGVMEVYKVMRENKLGFFAAAEKRYGWDKEDLDKFAKKIVK